MKERYQLVFEIIQDTNHYKVLGSTQHLTEMSTRKIPGGKGGPACKTDNVAAICEPII
jgi:hypothetical protein